MEDQTDSLIIEIPNWAFKELNGKIKPIEYIIKLQDVWEFHKYDKDTFPSIPHGHNKETGDKLDVYNGYIYNAKTKKPLRILREKYLLRIQSRLKEKGFDLN